MKKMKMIRQALFCALFLWGFISFCFLAGNDDPGDPMTLTQFCMQKAGAAASLYLCIMTGKIFYRNGLLPRIDDQEPEEEEKEDWI